MFNTGNPVPSTDARDLSDNAESIDQITNGTATVTTRTGKVIKSIGPIVDTVDAAATQGLVDIAADVSTVDASATQAEIDILARVNEVGVIYDSPIRPWSASLLVSDLRAHKEGDEVYIPTKALPFTTGATFNTSDWMLLQGVTNGDIDNDISIVKVHQNVAAFKADTTEYPDGKTIHLNDRDADFIKITGTGTATGGRIIANTSVNQSIVLDVVDVANIHQFGAAAGEPDSSTRIQEAIDYAFSLVNKIDVVVPPASTPYRYSEIVNKGVLRGTGGVLKQLDNIAIDPAVIYYTLHNFSTVPSAWYDGAKYLDLIIDGNGANNPKANFLTFDVITAAGVGTDVKGCTITDSPDSGIMYTFIEQGECSGNTLDGGTDLGIYVNDFEAGALTDGAMVKGNIIKNYPNGGIGVKRGTSNVSIDGNTINNCGQGITHEAFGSGSGGNPSKTSIINNKLSKIGYPFRGTLQPEAAGEVGLSLIGFHNGLCANNTVNDVSGVGANITGDGFTFNDNKITASDPSNIIPTANGNIGVIVQSTALDGGVTDGILNDNTVTGFRDDGLDVRTVAALQIIGGYYESYGFNGVTIAATSENVQMDGVKGFASSGMHKDFENLGGQVFARNCVSPNNGFYPFNFQNSLDTPIDRIVSSGTVSFVASNSVTFAHGLTGAPVNVQLTPVFNGNNTPVNATFISGITATDITINTSGGSFTYDVHWLAHRYSPT